MLCCIKRTFTEWQDQMKLHLDSAGGTASSESVTGASLRERRADIAVLAQYYADEFSVSYQSLSSGTAR